MKPIFLNLIAALSALATVPEDLSDSDWGSIREAYEAGKHQFHRQEDGTQAARNPGQGWKMAFDARGFSVTPDDGSWSWGLELVVDASGNQQSVEGTSQKMNRLTFQRTAAIHEWYVNDQRGLEQGWTLSAPAEIRLKVRGGLKPSVSAQTVSFGGTVNYGGLKAWDKKGRSVRTWFEPSEEGFSVRYDDTDAQYPITIDPIAQQAYLKASNTGAGDGFGWSVAVSGDTVLVGAPYEDSNATGVNGTQSNNSASDSGAAYVFVRSGGVWIQQAYLKAGNAEAGDEFGRTVAVSGNTIVVGAYLEDSSSTGINSNAANNGASNSGAAYVYVRNGGFWSQQAYLKASNTGTEDRFGVSVAINGETIVVGAPNEDSASTTINGDGSNNAAESAGAAYVFTRSGTTWSQQAYLKASNAGSENQFGVVGDRFGSAVAISNDTIVAGAPFEASNATGVNGNGANNSTAWAGAAYVFYRSGSSWGQQAYLKASSIGSMVFASSVAISGDNIVVGAPHESGGGYNAAGAAYVFSRTGTNWVAQADLRASNLGANDNFGIAVAIKPDMIAIGAGAEGSAATGINGDGTNNNAPNSGAAYVFIRSAGTWTQNFYLKASNTNSSDLFGAAIAMDDDSLIVGARGEASSETEVNGNQGDNSLANAGAAYVFTGLGPAAPDIGLNLPSGYEVNSGSQLNYGDTQFDWMIRYYDVTIKNTGNSALTGISGSFSGPDANQFRLWTSPPSSLDPGQSATFRLDFAPTSLGFKSATLNIASNDPDENPFTVSLSGTGIPPNAEIDVASPPGTPIADGGQRDFGGVYANGSKVTVPFTITNQDFGPLTGLGVTITGADASQFTIVKQPQATLNWQQSTTFEIRFQTTSVGSKSATLRIASNDSNENPYDIAITGTGDVPPPVPEIVVDIKNQYELQDGYSAPFGSRILGDSATEWFVIRNHGNATLSGINVTISGEHPDQFSVISQPAATIAPGQSSEFEVKFQPTSLGWKFGDILITSNDSDESPFTIYTSGQAERMPGIPILKSPGSKSRLGMLITTLTPTLSWSASRYTAEYYVQVFTAIDEQWVCADFVTNATSWTVPVGNLQPGVNYYWTVRPHTASGMPGSESAAFYFNVAQELPRPSRPALKSPGNSAEPGKLINSLNPVFTWTTSNDVWVHEIVVFDQLTNTEVYHVESQPSEGTDSLPAGTLIAGGYYRWRLRVSNAAGYGPWSSYFYFQTASPTPLAPAPVLVFPGAALTSAPPTYLPPEAAPISASTMVSLATATTNSVRPFEWKPIAGAQSYTLIINETNSDAPPVLETNVIAPARTFSLPPGLLETNKVYRWVVVANTATGISPASKALHFKTPVQWPAPVINTVSPTQVVSSTTAQWIRLDGTSFQPGVSVWLTAPGASEKRVVTARTQFVTSRIVRFKMPITPAGSWSVRVQNPDLQSSETTTFTAAAASGTLLPPVLTPAPTVKALTQPVSVSLSQNNAEGTEIRYTLDGTVPDRFSTLYEGTPIFMGSQSKQTIRAICVNDTAPPSTTTTGEYKFSMPSLPLASGGATMDDIPVNGSRVFRLTMVSGRATFNIRSDASQPIGSMRFYIAKDRIPTEADYDDRSVRNPLLQSVLTEQQQLINLPALPGTYFVLVKRGDLSGPLGRLTVSTTTGSQTVPPIVKPNSGFHFAPLRLVMEPRWFTTIYYTLDGSSPQPPPFGQGKTFAYTDPSSHSTGMRIRACAYRTGERMSTIVERLYNIGTNDINLTLEPDNVWDSDFVQTRKTSLSTVVNWGPGSRVERTFSFTVPEDPRVEANSSQITYPVALLMNVETQGIPQPLIYLLENGPTPVKSNSAGAFLVSNLPKLDSDRDYHSLGPVQVPKSYRTRNMKGRALRPGATYYGLIQTWGALVGSGQLKIDFQLHSARLESSTSPIKYAVDQTTALDNSWIVIHGRDNHASSPRIVDAADALVAATTATPTVARQVLRLNWGTLAKPSGSGPLSLWGIGSLDEAMFTECVGKRTDTILTQWGILPSDRSLLGHSWGSYVAYEIAKATGSAKVKRLIALDPAATGTGDYPDSEINFAKHASKSWSIVSAFTPGELFGSYRYAGTAGETFAFHSTSNLSDPFSLHNVPLDLFTHFTRCNYDTAYPHYGEVIIAPRFAIQRLDNGQGSAPHQLNALPRYINDPLGDSGPPNVPQRLRTLEGIFEGNTDAASEGLDLTDPAALRLRIITGGVETPLQPIWP